MHLISRYLYSLEVVGAEKAEPVVATVPFFSPPEALGSDGYEDFSSAIFLALTISLTKNTPTSLTFLSFAKSVTSSRTFWLISTD